MPHKGKKLYKNKEKRALKITKKKRRKLHSKLLLKNKRLIVKNLPSKATEGDLQEYLKKFGEISQVKFLKKPDGSPNGSGFIQFADDKNVAEVFQNCSGKEFMGKKIYFIKPRPNPQTENIVEDEIKSKSKEEGSASAEESESGHQENNNKVKSNKKKKKRLSAKEFKNARTGRLIVKNLPFKITEDIFQKHFEEYGEIVETTLLKKADGKLVGCGFVQFTDKNCAAKAVRNCNGKPLLGRKMVVGWVVPKPEAEKKIKLKSEEEEGTANEERSESTHKNDNKVKSNKNEKKRLSNKKFKNANKGRLIVRNLPFKVTEDILQKHFEKFGEIVETTLLKKADGKLVGCGFVQFTNKNCAAKAIHDCSGKPLLGRTIIVDWAIPKSEFKLKSQTAGKEEIKIKKESDDEDSETLPSNLDDSVQLEVKKEQLSDESEDDSEENHSDSDDTSDDGEEESEEEMEHEEVKKPKVISNDVSEGRTVFIKNVPFCTTNEELKTCMEQFGKVNYALVCIDPVTEHSKGTAFVKFQKKESAEECLSAGTELTLHDQTIEVHTALSKEELQNKTKKVEKTHKDSRNLYLVKEGVVVAGSKAAVGVSVSDMTKRLEIEKLKTQMLRNLNMYVSRTRLIVYNIPPLWTDAKLRQLFVKHAGPKAVVKEARVIRDMKNIDAEGIGRSKEFGFVTFADHESALQALRNINNNPAIFSVSKRPIVGFSIENKAILKIKQKRLEKSRAKNPYYSGENNKTLSKKSEKTKRNKRLKSDNTKNTDEAEEKEAFVGVTSKPGTIKMRNRFRLDMQAKIHGEMVHKMKKKNRKQQRLEQQRKIRKEKIKDSQKISKKRKHEAVDTDLKELVKEYKTKLLTAPAKRWFDG